LGDLVAILAPNNLSRRHDASVVPETLARAGLIEKLFDCFGQLIRQYDVSDASDDSQKFDELLNRTNTSADICADSAYRSAEVVSPVVV